VEIPETPANGTLRFWRHSVKHRSHLPTAAINLTHMMMMLLLLLLLLPSDLMASSSS
jgi:hypothetical protein